MKIIKKIAVAIALIGGVASMNAQVSLGGGLGFNETARRYCKSRN